MLIAKEVVEVQHTVQRPCQLIFDELDYQETLKLFKIVKSSQRVREARRMFYLKEGEYIVNFVNDKTNIINEVGEEKLKKLTPENKSDLETYFTQIEEYVEREIQQYFGIQLPIEKIMNAIFQEHFVPRSFIYTSKINRKGYFQITLEFLRSPTGDDLKKIRKKLEKDIFMVEEFYRIQNTKGLYTKLSSFQQIKKIDFFDEVFELYCRYKNLQRDFRRIPKDELQTLLQEARTVLKKDRGGFNERNLRKIMKDFRQYFFEV